MTGNGTFFALLIRRFGGLGSPYQGITDAAGLEETGISFEPTFRPVSDNIMRASVRITHGARVPSVETEGPSISISMAMYDYIDLMDVDQQSQTATPIEDLTDEVMAMQDEQLSEERQESGMRDEITGLLSTWQDGYNRIVRRFGHDVALHPITWTVEPREEIEREVPFA